MREPTHIDVTAEVRYWEDASVNGVEDEDGTLIPFRRDANWCPRIRLRDGVIESWPQGMTADIHYKVCDQGTYRLSDADGRVVAKYRSDYVPDAFLCHGDRGYGDYIILVVGADGKIANWYPPKVHFDEWEEIAE